MKSIRGAIAVVENTDEDIVNASKSLINSIMNVIIEEKLFNSEYIKKQTEGFD